MIRRAILAGALAAMLVPAATAQAGTYTVYACTVNNTAYDNRSWVAEGAAPAGEAIDTACPKAGTAVGVRSGAGTSTPANTVGGLIFRAPAGTTIADFRLQRRLIFNDPPGDGYRQHYAIYQLGPTVFGGVGAYGGAAFPTSANISNQVVTKASFAELKGYRGDATALAIRVGCYRGSTPCNVPAGGDIRSTFFAAEITLTDNGAPTISTAATGLLAGGQRHGSDPVTVTASDASGIRRVELIDTTDPVPQVVGAEDYSAGALTDRQAGCSARLAHSCPDLSSETVQPTSLAAGRRTLVVRVYDTAGNHIDQGPFTVDVITPSNRGAFNGSNATDTATVTAAFAHAKTRRTASYGSRATIVGHVANASGAPIGDAELHVLTRDLNRDVFVDRGVIRTAPDGHFSYRPAAVASRLIQFAWRSHVNDTRFTASGYVTLRARASATLSAPRSVHLGGRLTLTGRLRGVRAPGGVDVVAQGRSGHAGFRTFRLARTGRSGRFVIRYRFQNASSRGRSFAIRVRILPRANWPYESGVTRTVHVRVR